MTVAATMTVRTLYVASSNAGKLRDFSLAAAGHDIQILPLPGLEAIEPPAEDGLTFEDNAREKAVFYSRFLPGATVLADDSGLEVEFLQAAPGIRSARYAADAGFHTATTLDANNNLYLLQQLAGVADAERGARYCCVLATAQDGVSLLTAEGTVRGRLLTAPRGSGGFGYDPLFYLPHLDRTMAELDDQTRWTMSHRGQAFRALLQRLGDSAARSKRNLDDGSLAHQ